MGLWNALRQSECHFGEPEKLVFRDVGEPGLFTVPQLAATHLFVAAYEHQIDKRPESMGDWQDLSFPQKCLELGYRGLDFVEVWRSA